MARLITKAGNTAPAIDSGSKLTFDFNPNNADCLDLFPLQMLPWGYSTKLDDRGKLGSVKNQLMNEDGEWVDVWQEPYGIGDQVVTNGELQYFVRDHEIAAFNLPTMVEVANGEMAMYCRQTPDNFKDVAITGADTFGDFPVVAVDQNARTITVSGLRYSRKRPSDNGQYPRGSYIGFERFLRDELTGDAPLDASWKRRQYDYGLINIQPSGSSEYYKRVKYTSVTDSHSTDPTEDSGQATTHVLTIASGEMSNDDWSRIAQGGVIKLFRRLPWIAPQLSTGGNFSQKYFIMETEIKMDNHAEQFFAIWAWGNYLKMFDTKGTNATKFYTNLGVALYNFDAKHSGATELDCVEWPGGGDWYTKYHNIHAPGVGGMLDYAQANNIVPVMDRAATGKEWDDDIQAGHIIAIPRSGTDFTDYGEWHNLRVEWLPPNHARNPRSISIVNWYVGQEGQPLRFLCGVIAPPWWDENPGLAKQFFINNSVGGNFVNDNEFVYAKGHGSTRRDDVIVNRMRRMRVWQVAGEVAGGYGYPDFNSNFSRGFLPSVGDHTGGSGTGTVVGGYTPPVVDPVDPTDPIVITPVDPTRNRIRLLVNNRAATGTGQTDHTHEDEIDYDQVTQIVTNQLANVPKIQLFHVDFDLDQSIDKSESPTNVEALGWASLFNINAGDYAIYTTPTGATISYKFGMVNTGLSVYKDTARVHYDTIPPFANFTPGVDWKIEINIDGEVKRGMINQNGDFVEDI